MCRVVQVLARRGDGELGVTHEQALLERRIQVKAVADPSPMSGRSVNSLLSGHAVLQPRLFARLRGRIGGLIR